MNSLHMRKDQIKGQIIGWWWKDKAVLNDNENTDSRPANSSSIVTLSANELVKGIRKKMLKLKAQSMTEDGKSVNYEDIKVSRTFSEYLDLVRQLKFISMEQLSESEKKSFLINIYNCLILHAIISGLLDLKGGTLARMKLYATASYNIGGNIYSLNELENGLLRGNRVSAVPFTGVPFRKSDDPRLQNVLKCDPRIHFALNCGAKSCPPIAVYSTEYDLLDSELALATQGFLDQSVTFDTNKKSVTLSMLFSWYSQDFGKTDDEILDWVRSNGSKELKAKFEAFEETLRDTNENIQQPRFGDLKIKISHDPYIWDLNG